MKRVSLFLISLLFVLLFVSCPNGLDVPRSGIYLNFRLPVERGVSEKSVAFNYDNMDLYYKATTVYDFSVTLRGTQENWTLAEQIKNTDNAYYNRFYLGEVTPTLWKLDLQLRTKKGETVYEGSCILNVEQFDAVETINLKDVDVSYNNFLTPAFEDKLGTAVININTDMVLVSDNVDSVIQLRYRYNNSREEYAREENYAFKNRFRLSNLEVPSETEILDLNGNKVGTLKYNSDKTGYILTFENVPYGYYLLAFSIEALDKEAGMLYEWDSMIINHGNTECITLNSPNSSETINVKLVGEN